MTYSEEPDKRPRLIAGLLDLAIFLDSNADVLAPSSADVLVFPPGSTDAERRAGIDAIAARIGGQARQTAGGHYTVSRWFGPVEYRAVAIPHDNDGKEG